MNKSKAALAWLCTLLMIFSLNASAITLNDADIEHPYFPWRDYTFKLALVSSDAGQVNDQNANLVLRFESAAEDFALEDVKTFSEEFFLSFSIEKSTEYGPSAYRIAESASEEKCRAFELLYNLDDDSWEEELNLRIGKQGMAQRIIVRIFPNKAAAKRVEKPTPSPSINMEKELLPGLNRAKPGMGFMQADDLAEQYDAKRFNDMPLYMPKSPQPLNAYLATHPDCEVGINKDGMYQVSEKGLSAIAAYLKEWMGEIREQSRGAIQFVENPDEADILIVARQSYFFHANYRVLGAIAKGYGCRVLLQAKRLTAGEKSPAAVLDLSNVPGDRVSLSGTGDFWMRPPKLKGTDELSQFVNEILIWYGLGAHAAQSEEGAAAVQQALIKRGLLSGKPSGVFDAQTKEAVMQLQALKGLAVTGEVDEKTLIALYYDE